jgi:hypothetical protein
MRNLFTALAVASTLAFALPAAAQTKVYDTPTTTAPNQNWQGTMGLDFTVNAPVKITQLGAFDAFQDGIQGDVWVGIYDLSTSNLLTSMDLKGAVASSGSAYAFKDMLTPLVLGPGNYQLAAWGFGTSDPNYNSYGGPSAINFNSLGGRLSTIDVAYANDTGIGTIHEMPTTRYGAGSMVAGAVPEPATWALMLGGFGFAGLSLRRRQSKLQTA